MTTFERQKGQTTFQVFFIIAAVGFILTCLLKLGPYYVSDFAVSKVLKSIGKDPEIADMNNGRISQAIHSRFSANSIRGSAEKNVKVSRNGGLITATVDYEERIHMFANIDVLLMFKNKVEFEEIK